MAPGLGVAALGLAIIGGQARPRSASPAAQPCVRAVLVDGQLRCDDELPASPALLCIGRGAGRGAGSGPGGAQLPTALHVEPIAAGDVFETAQLCAHRAHPGVWSDGRRRGRSRMSPSDLAALNQPVNINRASVSELTSLPRVGPVLARRIVEGRPYADPDALLRVRGIGPATLRRVRARVTVEPSPP
ncbi:MAG: helix-hairpin-helix domain-containing protein [Myxococcota bacterium]